MYILFFRYHGEKLQGWGKVSMSTRQPLEARPTQQHLISTVFDRPQDVDPSVPTLRTHEPTTLSHRHNRVQFTKKSEFPSQH